MAINDIAKLTITWGRSGSDRKGQNILYFRQVGSLIFDTPEEDLVECFRFNIETTYAGLVTSSLQLESYKVGLTPPFNTSYVLDGLNIAGGQTGDPMPPRTSCVLNMRTANFTRRGRGRLFLLPANEAANTAGLPNSGFQNAVLAMAQDIKDMVTETVNFAGWEWVVWSEADQVARPITTVFISQFWGTQKDRKSLY